MKKAGFLLVLLLVFASALLFFPFVFKDKIKQNIIDAANAELNGKINFESFNFDYLKGFPYLGLTFNKFQINGKGPFANDTLIFAENFTISVNLVKWLINQKIEIKSLNINKPIMRIWVGKNGLSNIEEMFANQSTVDDSSTAKNFSIDLKKWEINSGSFEYKNAIDNHHILLKSWHLKGNGDFKNDQDDLKIFTKSDTVTIIANGVPYVAKKFFAMDATIDIDLKNNKYALRNHYFQINDCQFELSGFIQLLKNDKILANLNLEIQDGRFKKFLSLMPGIHRHQLSEIEADGSFDCKISCNGLLNDSLTLPKFNIDLGISEGNFKYQGMAKSIQKINLHLHAYNKTGIREDTKLHLTNCFMQLGNNPIQGILELKGWDNPYILADFKAKVNLAHLHQIIPLKGFSLSGLLDSEVKINGHYNQGNKLFPVVEAFTTLQNGSLQKDSLPFAITKINASCRANNNTGLAEDTQILIDSLRFALDGAPFQIAGMINNLSDPLLKLEVLGNIDLEKISHFLPSETPKTKGILAINTNFEGKVSAIKAKDMSKLVGDGNLEITNFWIQDAKWPYALSAAKLNAHLSAHALQFNAQNMLLGHSKLETYGTLHEPLQLFTGTNDYLDLELSLNADTLNFSEWLGNNSSNTIDSNSFLPQFPINYRIHLLSSIAQIKFKHLIANKVELDAGMSNGVLKFNKCTFECAKANFEVAGSYDPSNIKDASFETNIKVDNLDINLALAQILAMPSDDIDQTTDGIISSSYQLKGKLTHYNTIIDHKLEGNGTIYVKQAKIKGLKMFHELSKITKRKELHEPIIEPVKINTKISNRRIFVSPTSLMVGKYNIEVEGNQSFNNELNYNLKIGVPHLHKIKIPLHVGGNASKPKISLGKGHENEDFSSLKY